MVENVILESLENLTIVDRLSHVVQVLTATHLTTVAQNIHAVQLARLTRVVHVVRVVRAVHVARAAHVVHLTGVGQLGDMDLVTDQDHVGHVHILRHLHARNLSCKVPRIALERAEKANMEASLKASQASQHVSQPKTFTR